MRVLFTLVFALGTMAAAHAQDDSLTDIPVEEWRELALGRTLTYQIGGAPFALERYARVGNQVELQFADGTCYTGRWKHVDNLYCFDWGDTRDHCFRHVRVGNQILVINVVDGAQNGDIQEMTHISDAPLNCSLGMS